MNLFFKVKRAIACKFLKKKVSLNLSKPLISFAFDDIPDSAITNGARILSEYGYKGTFYVSLGLADNHNKNKNYFDHSKLKQLVADGAELACHTADHIALYRSGRRKILNNLKKNKEKINQLIPGYEFKNFSYPSGQQTFRSKWILKKQFRSARGVKAGMHSKEMDLYNLHANEMGDKLTLKLAVGLIEEAIRTNAWLIFYTHEVEDNPSAYGCTAEFFESVVKYCYKKNVEVLTVNKALDKILLGKPSDKHTQQNQRLNSDLVSV